MPGAPAPKFQGHLSKTPFAHVLLSVMKKKLGGTLVVWPEGEAAGQDRILIRDGVPVAARLLEPLGALDRSLLPIFRRRSAAYAFYEGNLLGQPTGLLTGDVSVWMLIAASLRGPTRDDAISLVLQKYDGKGIRLKRNKDIELCQLTREEKALLELLKAAPGRVEEFVEASGDGRRAQRMVYLLTLLGAIETFDPKRISANPTSGSERLSLTNSGSLPLPEFDAPEEPAVPERESILPGTPNTVPPPPPALDGTSASKWTELAKLADAIDNQTYFEMLGLEISSSEDQAEAHYLALIKRVHPDRLPSDLAELRPHMERVVSELSRAKDTLTDSKIRGKYIAQVQAGGGTPKADRELQAVLDAAMSFQKAEVLLRRKEYARAEELIAEVIKLNPSESEYYAARAWARFKQHGLDDRVLAETIQADLRKAVEINEGSERAHYYSAMVHKRRGAEKMALDHFKRVLEINPKSIEAQREVRIAEMRGIGGSKKEEDSAAGEAGDSGSFFSKLLKSRKK